MITLKQKLSEIEILTNAETEILHTSFLKNQFRKGQILLTPGQNLRELYFIESGFMRGYFTHNNIDETIWVIDGGSFLVPCGIFSRQRVRHYIEALGDTIAYMLPLDAVHFDESIPGHAIRKLLLYAYDECMRMSERRENISHIPQAKDRYKLFKAEFPHIIGQVNNNVMASMLKMSLKHFVRLKSADI